MSQQDQYYENYWKTGSGETWSPNSGQVAPDERKFFAQYLPKGKICLDYGCGNGLRYGAGLAASGVDYRGFDISTQALQEARKGGLEVGQLTPDGKTTLSDEAVDVAICFEVLEHLMEPDVALAEIRRCLRPGGTAILSVPNAAFYQQRIEFLLTGFWCPGGSPLTARQAPWRDPHIRFYHPGMLRRMVEASGFQVQELRGENFSLRNFPVIWKKPSLHPMLDALSLPFAWLGRVFPGLFSKRLFIIAQRPA